MAVRRGPRTALLAAALVAAACGGDAAGASEVRSSAARATADPATIAPLSGALDRFGGELYTTVAAAPDVTGRNVALSPSSVAAALLLTRAGARGDTRAEIDAVMHLGGIDADGGQNAIEQALAARNTTMKGPNGEKLSVQLSTANASWAQRGYPIDAAYLDTLARSFGAGLHIVDYMRATEAARRTINAWVAQQTAQKITELLPAGVLDASTRLVLTNALYLKASWAEPFETRASADGAFTRADGSTVTARFMNRTDRLGYASGDGWRVVELPYAGGQLAMDVIVPDAGRFAAIERSMASGVGPFVAGVRDAEVRVALPRFTFRTKVKMNDALASLGIVQLFDPDRADLSGITTAERLYVSDVLHEAYLAVTEEGTEAAAATAVVAKASAAPARIEEVLADRPFLFVLRDRPTGAVLMLGRVLDPTQSSGG